MLKLYEKIKEIVKSNQTGPTTYLYPMYIFYFPILANKMKNITENIFSQREVPSLEVWILCVTNKIMQCCNHVRYTIKFVYIHQGFFNLM